MLALKFEDYMLPCLTKKFMGIDCLGCGLQRAISFLIQGEFLSAFKMYPAIYTLILLFSFILINLKFKFNNAQKIITILAITNIAIIIANYILKLNQLT